MKAIHNLIFGLTPTFEAVNYTQRYKKWKQFTTKVLVVSVSFWLWTIHKDTKNESNSQRHWRQALPYGRCELYTKIQKMKAIHNEPTGHHPRRRAVNYTQRYKKWKQFTTELSVLFLRYSCELYTKIQKMKAIHNCPSRVRVGAGAVNYTQRYKKWKQFTTPRLNSPFSALLWTIHKDTKNESNSQLGYGSLLDYLAVNYTQRYKKWKQFTTWLW